MFLPLQHGWRHSGLEVAAASEQFEWGKVTHKTKLSLPPLIHSGWWEEMTTVQVSKTGQGESTKPKVWEQEKQLRLL